MVLHQMPKDDGGWNSHGMTQKMLDAYYMNDGTDCPGMNSMYMGVTGYEDRVDSRERRTGFTGLQDLKMVSTQNSDGNMILIRVTMSRLQQA